MEIMRAFVREAATWIGQSIKRPDNWEVLPSPLSVLNSGKDGKAGYTTVSSIPNKRMAAGKKERLALNTDRKHFSSQINLKRRNKATETLFEGETLKTTVMNYGISILFRAIPLLMALFCFGYGAFVLHEGLDSAKFVAGRYFHRDDLHCLVRHSGNNH